MKKSARRKLECTYRAKDPVAKGARMRTKLGIRALAVAVAAGALAVGGASGAQAATRQYNYVANDDEGHVVSSFEKLPVAVAPRGIVEVTPIASFFTVRVNDASATKGQAFVVEVATGSRYWDLCAANGSTYMVRGVVAGEPIRLTVGGNPGPYSIRRHCTGVATTGVLTVQGVR
jgi:hypothetical protein